MIMLTLNTHCSCDATTSADGIAGASGVDRENSLARTTDYDRFGNIVGF